MDSFVHQVVDDWRGCPLSGAVRRLLEWAEMITRTPAACSRTDVEELRAAGWSDPAIHDAAQVIAYFNYINRIADGLGTALEPGMPRWGRRTP